MSFQEYLDSLKIGDAVIVKDKGAYYECVVSSITPTRVFKVSRLNDNYVSYSFNKQGKIKGNKYFTEIVNKFDDTALEAASLRFAKDKMLMNVCRVVSFLDKQKTAYSPKNSEIVLKIQRSLEEWESIFPEK